MATSRSTWCAAWTVGHACMHVCGYGHAPWACLAHACRDDIHMTAQGSAGQHSAGTIRACSGTGFWSHGLRGVTLGIHAIALGAGM